MEEILLDAEQRQEIGKGKVKHLRDAGFLPAVVYFGGKNSLALKISRSQLIKLVHQYHIETAVINLKVKDDTTKKSRPCLIKEIQYDPVRGDIVHVDFNEISLTKAIKVNVPVVAKGDSIGVKQEGGSLEHILWEVEVECLPTSIPKEIEIDITQLKLGDSIHVKDIVAPSGVKILTEPEGIVLTIAAPMKEEVAAPVEGEEVKEPEVIKEKKEVPAAEGAEEGKEKEKK